MLYSTVIFLDFNHADIRSNNYDNINICRARLISTGKYKMFLFLKIWKMILKNIFNPLYLFHNFTKYESGEIILTKLNHL